MKCLNRRRFLKLSTALAAAAALPGCQGRREIPGKLVQDDAGFGHLLRDGIPEGQAARVENVGVLIAGAGAAGLAAAWRLRRAGVEDFRLLELSARPGGTAVGGKLKGLAHPWGAHYLPLPLTEQRALCAFLEDVGLGQGHDAGGRLKVSPELLVRAPVERLSLGGFYQEGLWPEREASLRERQALARFEALVEKLGRPPGPRPFRLPLEASPKEGRELDRQGAQAWLASQGFTGPHLRWYLEYATRDDYGSRLKDTSAWALLHYFCARLGPHGAAPADDMTWPEGNQHLISRLAAPLGKRLLTSILVTRVSPKRDGVLVGALERTGRQRLFLAQQVVLALPQYVVRRVVVKDRAREARRAFRYAPWVVANLHLQRLPENHGFEWAWDNVRYESQSLGYVDAGHQLDREGEERVWTWYLPLVDPNEARSRRTLSATSFESLRDLVLADLRPVHPDIGACVDTILVRMWGHAMIKPVTGFLWGPEREAAARSQGRLHFGHSDVGGLPLFEQALWSGCRAAEGAARGLGQRFESLL